MVTADDQKKSLFRSSINYIVQTYKNVTMAWSAFLFYSYKDMSGQKPENWYEPP